jgi:hypothetical protein
MTIGHPDLTFENRGQTAHRGPKMDRPGGDFPAIRAFYSIVRRSRRSTGPTAVGLRVLPATTATTNRVIATVIDECPASRSWSGSSTIPILSARPIALDEIVIDAKIGATGAGRSLEEAMLFSKSPQV